MSWSENELSNLDKCAGLFGFRTVRRSFSNVPKSLNLDDVNLNLAHDKAFADSVHLNNFESLKWLDC